MSSGLAGLPVRGLDYTWSTCVEDVPHIWPKTGRVSAKCTRAGGGVVVQTAECELTRLEDEHGCRKCRASDLEKERWKLEDESLLASPGCREREFKESES